MAYVGVAPTPVVTTTRSSGSAFIWIFVVIFVLIIIGLIIWWAVRRNRVVTSGTTTTTSSTWVWAIGAALLIILILGALFYFFSRDDDDNRIVMPGPVAPIGATSNIVQGADGRWKRVTQPPPVTTLVNPPPIIEDIPMCPPMPACPMPVPACPPGYRPLTTQGLVGTPVLPVARVQDAELLGEAAIYAEIRETNRRIERLTESLNTPCQLANRTSNLVDGQKIAPQAQAATQVVAPPAPVRTVNFAPSRLPTRTGNAGLATDPTSPAAATARA
jgi:hypothetical protein